MIILRDYQEIIVSKIRTALRLGHTSIMIQSPTGSGKTVIFSFISHNSISRDNKVLIITDRNELLSETGGTLKELDLSPTYIQAGCKITPKECNLAVAMAQTLRNRLNNKHWVKFLNSFDIVIIDEAHKQEFNPFFEAKIFKGIVLGFSATPKRTGKQRQLASDYSFLIDGLTVPELIDKGFLVKDRQIDAGNISLENISINSKGDFQESQLYDRYNKPEVYGGAVKNWIEHAKDTITLGFCVNIQHCIECCKEFNNAGIEAKFLVSGVSKPTYKEDFSEAEQVKYDIKLKEFNNFIENYNRYSGSREKVLSEWKSGKFKVLFNAGILTTGFNFPAIETILMLRATLSDNLWLQMIGRGSRPFKDKLHFNILDFGSNGIRLGYYQTPRKYNLIHEAKKGGGLMPIKECGAKQKIDENNKKGCGSYIPVSSRICEYCGFIFKTEKEKVEVVLTENDYIATSDFDFMNKSNTEFADLERIREERGYAYGWIINQIIAKGGEASLSEYLKYKGYNHGWLSSTIKRYRTQIEAYNRKAS